MIKPKLIVVIPCLNEEAHIADIIRGVLRETSGSESIVVVSDGGSSDRTRSIASEMAEGIQELFVVDNPKRLQSAGINLAMSNFGRDAEYMIRIDAHGQYPDNYIDTLVCEAEETGADSVVVGMVTVGSRGFQRAVADAQNSILGNGGSGHRSDVSRGRDVDHGHHALMRRQAFDSVGGYDPSFATNEDAELDYRLKAAGHRIWLTSRTAMTYYPRSNALALSRQYFRYGVGRSHTMLKHYMRPKLRQLAMIGVFPAVIASTLSPWWPVLAVPALAWALLCMAYGVVASLRARSHILMGPAAILMHLSWSAGFWSGLIMSSKRLLRPQAGGKIV